MAEVVDLLAVFTGAEAGAAAGAGAAAEAAEVDEEEDAAEEEGMLAEAFASFFFVLDFFVVAGVELWSCVPVALWAVEL